LGAQLQAPGGVQSVQLQQQVERSLGENKLFATGLDVDQLASEGFKPEDCEPKLFLIVSARTGSTRNETLTENDLARDEYSLEI